jgi:putative transposase
MAILASTDFFTVEVLTWRGLVTYYVLFFLHLETRRVTLAGFTRHPAASWMEQMARNEIDGTSGHLRQHRYILHDRDTTFCSSFRTILGSANIECLTLPPRSPNLNAFAERWVRSVKQECLSKLILFGESSLRRVLTDLLFPSSPPQPDIRSAVERRQRLGGLLNHYSRARISILT